MRTNPDPGLELGQDLLRPVLPVTPHIAIDGHLSKTGKRRKTAIDACTTRHGGYDISQRCRKRIEEVFGSGSTAPRVSPKTSCGDRARVDAAFTLALAAYNLIRLPKLSEAQDEHSGASGVSLGCQIMKPTFPI